MGLYDMTDGLLRPIPETSFTTEGVLERDHLQAALRDDVSLLGDDLLVVAEEFGDFEGSNRRIDLLCVDRSATIVVVELKRTGDGGHMELQSIRYAAMVSTMTMDDLVATYRGHLTSTGADPSGAEKHLQDWFNATDEEPVIAREVKIILVSAGFGKEITTTVLWLNELYGLDIRCIRLTPYRVDERLLLDVQPVIPLPEVAELTIQLRRKEQAAKTAKTTTKDFTRYSISSPTSTTGPLPKRRAICELVLTLHAAGVGAHDLNEALPNAKFFPVDEELEEEDLIDAFVTRYPKAKKNLHRWFFENPIHESGQTWVLSKMWGTTTQDTLEALVALAPEAGISYTAH